MIIRNVNIEDAKEILDIYTPYILNTAITFEYGIPSLDQFKVRIENIIRKYPYIVAVEKNEIIGYAYVSSFKDRKAYDWSVETSIYVKENNHHQGIGKALYLELESRCKDMHIQNLNACIAYPIQEDSYLDTSSVKFHEKLGYSMVGKFHQCAYKFNTWYDMVWMEKSIGNHEKNPKAVFE